MIVCDTNKLVLSIYLKFRNRNDKTIKKTYKTTETSCRLLKHLKIEELIRCIYIMM